jgi:hypothetical protein
MDAVGRVPGLLLRLEGAAVLAGSLALYFDQDFGWLALVVLLLAPDLTMIAYAAGPRVGAMAYDIAHTEALPVALGVVGLLATETRPVQLALIWLAHIGADRLLGYGLKYPSAFGATHLQRV